MLFDPTFQDEMKKEVLSNLKAKIELLVCPVHHKHPVVTIKSSNHFAASCCCDALEELVNSVK